MASDPPANGHLRLVTTEGLRLRQSPDGTVVRELTIGDPLFDLGPSADPGWRKVKVGADDGVVAAKYLREPGPLTTEALLKAAIKEWVNFDKGQGHEKSAPYYTYVGKMWAAIGESYDGRSRYPSGEDVPWSAAFISWVVREAGPAYVNFKFAASHSVFVNNAIKARVTNRLDKPFWGYRITEKPPALGDIIQRNRSGGTFTYSYAENHSEYISHSDIVVEVTPDMVRVVGGNVGNTVALGGEAQEYQLDARGFIEPGQNVIALLKNRAAEIG